MNTFDEDAHNQLAALMEKIRSENPHASEAKISLLFTKAALKDDRLAKTFLEDIAITLRDGGREM